MYSLPLNTCAQEMKCNVASMSHIDIRKFIVMETLYSMQISSRRYKQGQNCACVN